HGSSPARARRSGFPHLLIPTTALAPDARPKFEAFVFAGVDGRVVARSIFLDGNTFKDSHSVDKKYFVYDLKGGLSIRIHSWRFDYSLVRRSKEFDQGKDQIYGSISFSFERGF
ncbi:MAG: lipid A deacylase LpxR family protein, partial [bacterium]|nr:lipid A deacylase LpxR family protein [bacterium]